MDDVYQQCTAEVGPGQVSCHVGMRGAAELVGTLAAAAMVERLGGACAEKGPALRKQAALSCPSTPPPAV